MGYQTALMVPTEILAEQHARNLKRILARALSNRVAFRFLKSADKKRLHQSIATGEVTPRWHAALIRKASHLRTWNWLYR